MQQSLFSHKTLVSILFLLVMGLITSTAHAARVSMNITLDTAQSGGGARTGSGSGYAVLDLADNKLHYYITFSGLSAAEIMVHFHGPAAVGVDAGVLYTLPLGSPKSGSITLADPGGYTVASQIDDLLHGRWYVNVHSTTFPGGEIRGQVYPETISMNMTLDAAQDGGGARTGSGTGTATLNTQTNQLTYSISFSGMSSAEIAAHFHAPGAPGIPAGVVYGLAAGSPKNGTVNLVALAGPYSVAKQITDMLSGLWYVNVHSTNFPGGEIRGQALPDTCTTLADLDCDGVSDAADKFPLDDSKWQYARHDTNTDFDSDILIRSTGTGSWTSYAVQAGAITGNAAMNIPTSSDTQYMAQLDTNGDGDADVLTRSIATGAWTLHQVQSGAVISSAPIYLYSSLDWQFVGAGDFNGDGTDDVLLRSTSLSHYNSFLITNNAVATVNLYNAWPSPLSVDQGIGDFDGDGTDDLLVRRSSDNFYFIFRSLNGLVDSSYCACNVWRNPDWTFQFAGDTNHDGIDDIVTRATGASGDGLWWAFRMNNFMSALVTNLNLFNNKTRVSLGAVGDYNTDGTVDVLTRVDGATTYVTPLTNGSITTNNLLQGFTTDQVIQK